MRNRLKKRSICIIKSGQTVKLVSRVELKTTGIVWFCKVWLNNKNWSRSISSILESDVEKVVKY